MSSGPYLNPTNQAPGVKTGHILWINSFHSLILGETLKIFFSETIQEHQVLHNIDPADQDWPHPVGQ